MSWALKQGMIGGGQQTLTPSMVAMGPNSYLSRMDFGKMILMAMLIHGILLAIAALWPQQRVTDIPVRALNFKIGGTNRIAAFGTPVEMTPVAPQPITAPAPATTQWRAEPVTSMPTPKQRLQPVKQTKVEPIAPRPEPARVIPRENIIPPQPPTPAPQPTASDALPDTSVLTTHAAIAPNPQRFIRETGNLNGAIGGQGNQTTLTQATAQAVRERYEQQISGWIAKHILYPAAANGREGRAVVRMRIDRSGYVRYYAIEESSGSPILDAAAIDMIRRANPMPGVPAAYPAGNLIEFLIPIVFKVPQ